MRCCHSPQPFPACQRQYLLMLHHEQNPISCSILPGIVSRFCQAKPLQFDTGRYQKLKSWTCKRQHLRLCFRSAGGGVVHVGVMLRAAERGDGHGLRAGAAAGLRSRSGALPLRPQRWVLHLPPHQLRERRTAVQGLRTGLLCLQTQGKQGGCAGKMRSRRLTRAGVVQLAAFSLIMFELCNACVRL